MAARTTVKLDSAIFRAGALRKAADAALRKTAEAHLEDTRRLITSSVPSGRLYKRRRGFHRASARGQRPAVDTGNLIDALTAKQVPVTREWTVYVAPRPNRINGVSAEKYAEILQSSYGGRKIILPEDAAKFEKVLKANLEDELARLS